jgi:hypothetical protein
VDPAAAIMNPGCSVAMATSPVLSLPLVLTRNTKRYKCVTMRKVKAMNVQVKYYHHMKYISGPNYSTFSKEPMHSKHSKEQINRRIQYEDPTM